MSADKNKVLLINPTIYPEGVRRIEEEAEIIYAPDGRPDTLKEFLCQGVNGIIVRLEEITENIIKSGKDLKVIGVNGAGFSCVDVDAATKAGICVVNVVGANSYSVAEHIVMFTLAMARNIKRADLAVRSGNWLFRDTNTPHDIHGCSFFSVGFGNIGKEVCRIMKYAFNMQVYVYDPFFSKEEIEKHGYVKVDDFSSGASRANYLSLHLPCNENTHHFINKETIGIIKKGCKIINCARGPIIDYDALCDALESGHIDMAGIDVYPKEPVSPDHRIFTLENVIASPHCAGDTVEARTRIAISVADDVLSVLRGERPRCFVNPSVEEINPTLFGKTS